MNSKNNNDISHYVELSRKIRKDILDIIYETKSPHIGPSFSIVETLVALYFKFLNTSKSMALDPDRDRFILSKGHACLALYAVLAECCFISDTDLKGFALDGGVLEHHPNKDLSRGIEASTGSLGHGLSIGAGMALSGKIDQKDYKTYVMLGDGELNEGSIWEALMFAGHHKLCNLVALVDCNRIQALGDTKDIIDMDPIGKKWDAFDWHVQEIDGHNFNEIFNSLDSLSSKKPNVIILHTTKGKGVSFMENQLLWHYRVPDNKEYKLALEELVS